MTLVSVVVGAFAACVVAWVAIAGFAYLGELEVRLAPVRLFGAAGLAALALRVAGVPIPWILAPALLAVGLVAGVVSPLVYDHPEAG